MRRAATNSVKWRTIFLAHLLLTVPKTGWKNDVFILLPKTSGESGNIKIWRKILVVIDEFNHETHWCVGLRRPFCPAVFTPSRLRSWRIRLRRHQVAWRLTHVGRNTEHGRTRNILGESDGWQVAKLYHSISSLYAVGCRRCCIIIEC